MSAYEYYSKSENKYPHLIAFVILCNEDYLQKFINVLLHLILNNLCILYL